MVLGEVAKYLFGCLKIYEMPEQTADFPMWGIAKHNDLQATAADNTASSTRNLCPVIFDDWGQVM